MSFDWNYFYKGAVSGATGLLCSHPIDTIKSNVQEGKNVRWNLRSLYRGMLPPLFGMGLEKAIVFGTYQNVSIYIRQDFNCSDITKRGIAGASAGFAASFVVTPVERLKILYQTRKSIDRYGIGSLYRGFGNTLTREMPGFAIYFNVYEILKSMTVNPGIYHYFIYGGLSGLVAWSFIYPQDLIKTQIQSSNSRRGMDIVRSIYRTQGIRGFFRGFHLALLRAVPLHAGTFAMFEYLDKQTSNYD